MKFVKWIGLSLFVAGFSFFNYFFFASDYRLTPDGVKAHLDDARAALFLSQSGDLIDRTVASQFDFVAELKLTAVRANKKVEHDYGIQESELQKLLEASAPVFSIHRVDSLWRDSTPEHEFKRKAFRDYGSWLDGQPVTIDQLTLVADNIRQYAVIPTFGFDRYVTKGLLYSLTKASSTGPLPKQPLLFLLLSVGLALVGALMFIFPKLARPPGIQNNGIFFQPIKNTGWLGVLLGSWLILFYVVLYFYPEYMVNWIILVDPVSRWISGHEAGRFFLYGFIYTLCILVMGVRFLIHYRHSSYHLWRTASVMFFQTAFAFLIPEVLVRLNQPYFDFKNIWPLDYSFFFDYRLDQLMANGSLGLFMLVWGIVLIVVAVPVLVYFFGKRWYCSWACGCGGLAETLGDPFRQLSSKKISAWRVERWMIHAVLVFAVVMTGGVLYTYFTGSSQVLFFNSYDVREWYGALIGAGFAGVVGTGFYPLMGNRVWCRFGCPLAAYLGLVQRFKSRFRITTNGGQCISCGNCSTYCEMGIDVRWYAQRGQNIVRSSCVGCGVCSSVCPRGVLNLEVRDEANRFGQPVLTGNNGVVEEGRA